jgi:phage FluMu protein Com
MPIEFRCTQCAKLLRTADDTAGKQAKCPSCGAILNVPTPPAVPSEQSPFSQAGGAPSPTGGSPFGGPPTGAPETWNPYQSPADYTMTSSGFDAAIPPGTITPTLIDMGTIFSRTWAIFKDNWGMSLVVVVVCFIVNLVVGQIAQWGSVGVGAAIGDPTATVIIAQSAGIVAQLFGMWIGIGQALYFIKTVRGREASLGDIFAGGPYFLRILGATILFTCGWILLCGVCAIPGVAIGFTVGGENGLILGAGLGVLIAIVPMAIYTLGFSQYYYLIIDHNAGAVESLSLSWQVTRGNRLTIFAIGLIAGILGMLVVLFTCLLGILAVAPYMALLYPVMYLAMTGQPVAPIYQSQ